MPTAAENYTAYCKESSEEDCSAFNLSSRPSYVPVFSIPFQHPVPWHVEENRETALYSIVQTNRLLRETATP